MQGRVCNEKMSVKLYSELRGKIKVTQQTYVEGLLRTKHHIKYCQGHTVRDPSLPGGPHLLRGGRSIPGTLWAGVWLAQFSKPGAWDGVPQGPDENMLNEWMTDRSCDKGAVLGVWGWEGVILAGRCRMAFGGGIWPGS